MIFIVLSSHRVLSFKVCLSQLNNFFIEIKFAIGEKFIFVYAVNYSVEKNLYGQVKLTKKYQ